MKLAPSNPIQRVAATVALHCALFVTLATSSARALDGGGPLLQGQKMSPGGSFQFFFEASAGQTYPVGASPDLLHWTLLTNVVLGNGSPTTAVWIEDLDASKFQRRFYQIRPPAALVTPVPNMAFIPPGTFTMGSPQSEQERGSNEGPQTIVTLSQGFMMGKYEVTQSEYFEVTGTNNSFYPYHPKIPAEFQTWLLATNYCYMLTVRERAAGHLPEGYSYRLPTEAEWEYACRAGTTTPFAIGDGTSLSSWQANFDGTFPYGGAVSGPYGNRTAIVGIYQANPWGLYDMHGNVWEWCQDWYGPYPGGKVTDPKGPATGTARVLRGGGFTSTGGGCRSAKRDSRGPTYRHPIQGFRVVLAASP